MCASRGISASGTAHFIAEVQKDEVSYFTSPKTGRLTSSAA